MTAALPSFAGQRLPFLALLGAGVTGIVAAESLDPPPIVWLVAVLASGWWFWKTRKGFAFAALAASVFAQVHFWTARDSPGAHLAGWLAARNLTAEATGLVVSEPRPLAGNRTSFELRLERLEVSGMTIAPRATVLAEASGPAPGFQDRVRLAGILSVVEAPRNPGQFDFAGWLARRDIHLQLRAAHANDLQVLETNCGNPLVAVAHDIRLRTQELLTAGINDPAIADLLVAMVLGETSALPQQVEEEFRATGTFHLFSVSGLHVGMVAFILWQAFRLLRIPRSHAAALIIPLLFFYALMTGLKAASVRAAVMAAIILLGLIASRRPILFNNLCAAAFLILAASTSQLFHPSFQLSFGVVAAIMLFTQPLAALLARPFQKDPFLPDSLVPPARRVFSRAGLKLASLVSVSMAAWAGSLPLTLGYFHLVSLSALPANLLAVPLSFAIMAVAMLSVGTGLMSVWIAEVYNQTNWLLAKGLLAVIHLFAALPSSFFYVRLPPPDAPKAELVVFDFGNGGAVWLSSEGSHWLIDCGPAAAHDAVLLPFLRSQGRHTLDGLLLTHGDSQHLGSAPSLLRTCPPEQIIVSPLEDRSPARSRLHLELAARRFPKSLHRSGDHVELGRRCQMTILYPPSDLQRGVADDKAVVVLLTVWGTRILLMSDAGLFTEQWLVQNARDDLRSDILVRGAARNSPSGDPEFLNRVRPSIIVATQAQRPPSGEPESAASPRRRIFRQDYCGAVTLRIYTSSWKASAFLNGREYSRAHSAAGSF